jgi:3-dehydroquinate dehydratase
MRRNEISGIIIGLGVHGYPLALRALHWVSVAG